MTNALQSLSNLAPFERRGGRIASPALRHSLELCDDFAGLADDADRYQLLLLVKRAGEGAGFTPRMIALLDYYLAYTRDCDWEQGSRPIVYQSLSRTALDLGVTEQQIQKLEKRLFEVGALTWHDSGNHKRYGHRDSDTGRIVFAFGVDLTPLAYLRPKLEEVVQQQQLYNTAWSETKRAISWHRRQIRSLLAEREGEAGGLNAAESTLVEAYNEIAVQIRTHIKLPALRALLARHEALYQQLIELVAATSTTRITPSCISRSIQQEAHLQSTNLINNTVKSSPLDKGFQKSVAEPSEPSSTNEQGGTQHVTLSMAVSIASERFQSHLPIRGQLDWSDLVDAAYRVRTDLRISQSSWANACQVLGRVGATLCVLLTDRALDRDEEPVRRPAAYFRGMVNKATTGELRLHNSIFGLLEAAGQCH